MARGANAVVSRPASSFKSDTGAPPMPPPWWTANKDILTRDQNPLSLWERAEVRGARQPARRSSLVSTPHPRFARPLPEGEAISLCSSEGGHGRVDHRGGAGPVVGGLDSRAAGGTE